MKVINGNYRFHVYKGAKLVYNGNNRVVAWIYRQISRVDENYYVGDLTSQRK